MLIVNLVPSGQGWFPINYMVTLACELLEAKLIDLSDTGTTLFTKLAAIVSQRKASDAQEETCLLVCASPTDLLGIYKIEGWRTRFKFLAAWVIDSFWLEWIPMSVRLANPFDCIFITTGEHAEAWHRITGIDPIWLPWGTDVLRLGSGAEVREWDLLRVGRQPMQWDDDAATAALAANRQGKYKAFHNGLFRAGTLSDSAIKGIADQSGVNYDQLQKDMSDPKFKMVIDQTYALASALRIDGTPAYIVGDQLIPGAVELDTLKNLIDAQRAKLGGASAPK